MTDQALPHIGFVGLGNMGGPMARRLAGAGYPVTCFDINPEAMAEAVEAGCTAGGSATECAAGAEMFLTSLPRPDHVETVMAGPDGALAALQPGSIWVDLTTNRKELVQAYASQAPEGVTVVDSPVTGAVDGARTGKVTLFIGGDQASVDRVAPVLDNLGLVIKSGELGNENVVKLVTNQLWFIAAAAIGEGFATGMANSVDLDTLWYAIKESVGRNHTPVDLQLAEVWNCRDHVAATDHTRANLASATQRMRLLSDDLTAIFVKHPEDLHHVLDGVHASLRDARMHRLSMGAKNERVLPEVSGAHFEVG
ncbi:MAG: 3-hydroxyisobutyrate dehydrogenase-like beta-hydroxyacid dehydrogenase, partial [Candidatus Poriferisodalaceae bacterium]